MFVYNKGKLVRSIVPISQDEFIFRLTHVTTGMTIEVKYNSDNSIMNNPYKVYREVNDSYVIYEEFYKKNKTTKETFEEAILFFEDNIYKILGETPPVEGTPNPQPEDNTPPETFQEVPIVGDIIQVGNKYGVVTDIVDTQVVTKELSKEEAMRILKNQKNAMMSISQAGNVSDDLDLEIPSFDDGGSISSTIVFDTQKDKITILRVNPPKQGGNPPPPPSGENPPPPEPQPDNIKDPFEETPPPPPNDGQDKEGKDQEGKDKEGKDQEGKDKEGKDQDGKGEPDGEGKDGEGKDGEGEDGEDGKGKPDGEGGDGEFGDDDSDMQTLEELLKKIKDDFDSGKTSRDIQLNQDLDILENALSTPKDQIKNIFRSKAIVLSAIGRKNIFGTDNEQRLNDTLNEIFK